MTRTEQLTRKCHDCGEDAPVPVCSVCGMLAYGRTGDDMEAATLHSTRYGHWPTISDATMHDCPSDAPSRSCGCPVEYHLADCEVIAPSSYASDDDPYDGWHDDYDEE